MALHKTDVKMVNMRAVRLTYRVTSHLIISGTAGKKKSICPIWMWKPAVIRIKKTNAVINNVD